MRRHLHQHRRVRKEALMGTSILSLLLAISQPVAAAAPPPPETAAAIVVQGHRPPDPAVMRSAVRAIGRAKDVGNGDTQMARWVAPACPVVIGLPDKDARAFEAAIRAVAAEVNAPVGGAHCQRNIEVVVTSDPRAALLDVKAREPG